MLASLVGLGGRSITGVTAFDTGCNLPTKAVLGFPTGRDKADASICGGADDFGTLMGFDGLAVGREETDASIGGGADDLSGFTGVFTCKNENGIVCEKSIFLRTMTHVPFRPLLAPFSDASSATFATLLSNAIRPCSMSSTCRSKVEVTFWENPLPARQKIP